MLKTAARMSSEGFSKACSAAERAILRACTAPSQGSSVRCGADGSACAWCIHHRRSPRFRFRYIRSSLLSPFPRCLPLPSVPGTLPTLSTAVPFHPSRKQGLSLHSVGSLRGASRLAHLQVITATCSQHSLTPRFCYCLDQIRKLGAPLVPKRCQPTRRT